MSYGDLLHMMRMASLPVLIFVALVTLGAVCDMWTNSMANTGRRVWRKVKGNKRDISPN